MANKRTLKDHKKKVKEEAHQASSVAEQPINRTPFEDPASAVRTTATTTSSSSSAYTHVPTQLEHPQLSSNTSSPLRLVPIYDLNHLPIDWTTGDRFIPRLDKSSPALQNMRLIPIYGQNSSTDVSTAPSSTGNAAGQGSVPTDPNGIGGANGTGLQQNGMNSGLQPNADLPPNADVLEMRGNSNTQVKFILPEGLPPMVPALGGIRRGPGTKIVLEGNEEAQICMVPRDSVEESPLTSGEEITIKGNKKMQLFSGGGGGGSSEHVTNDSNDERDDTSNENAQDERYHKAKASVQVTNNTSSQIMGIRSAGAPGSSSNISNNQNTQIMNVPQLAPYRPPTSSSYAAPIAQRVQPSVLPIATSRLGSPGAGNNRQGSNNFALLHNQFREQVWRINKTLKSVAVSVNNKITLSKPTTTGFPRLRKRCVLRCSVASETSRECVVDVYESRLRINSLSEDDPFHWELNFSDIKGIRSTSSQNMELTDNDDKVTSFYSDESTADDIIDIALEIVSAVHSAFPEVPFQSLIPIFEISPEDRHDIAFSPYKNSPQRHDELPTGPKVDSALCGIRTFSLEEFFKQFPNGDIGLLKALRYNRWFDRFNAGKSHVTPACVECIAEILEKNTTLELLDFSQARLKPFSVQKLALALLKNPASKVVEVNFSNNVLSKKDVEALSAVLAMPNRGFKRLLLEKTGITATLTNELLRGIRNNVYANTLSCLNLSGLKSNFLSQFRRNNSIQSVGVFLGSPNKLQELNLSGGGMVLEEIVDSLADGCLSDLRSLELSGNYYSLASSKPVPLKWKRFFSEAQRIDIIGFSNTRLPASALKALFEGLSVNTFITERSNGVRLDVSRNNLGKKGADVLAEIAGKMQNIRSLDVTRNGMKNGLSLIFESYATNGGVKELLIGKNFTFLTQHRTFKQIGARVPRILEEDARNKDQAVEALIKMIKSDKSVVTSLDISSSNLGGDTSRIIEALGENKRIIQLNISGNDMGDSGAATLATMLRSNAVLKSISFDRNNLSINGLEEIVQVLWRHPSLKEVVLPSVDISTAQWENHEKAFELAEIFKLKANGASDMQSNVYSYTKKIPAGHQKGASSPECNEMTGGPHTPSLSAHKTGNGELWEDLKKDGLRDHRKISPISHSKARNSSLTTAIVHAESGSQSKDLSYENQDHNYRGELKKPPTLPEKRWQRDPPATASDAFLKHTKENASVTGPSVEMNLEKETLHENLKQKNESDTSKESNILGKEDESSLPVNLVVQLQRERDSLKFDKDTEVPHSTVENDISRKAPVRPAKPSGTISQQVCANSANKVEATNQDIE